MDLGLDDSSDEDEEGNDLEEGEIVGDDAEDDFQLAQTRHRGAKATAAASSSGGDVASGMSWGASGRQTYRCYWFTNLFYNLFFYKK